MADGPVERSPGADERALWGRALRVREVVELGKAAAILVELEHGAVSVGASEFHRDVQDASHVNDARGLYPIARRDVMDHHVPGAVLVDLEDDTVTIGATGATCPVQDPVGLGQD